MSRIRKWFDNERDRPLLFGELGEHRANNTRLCCKCNSR